MYDDHRNLCTWKKLPDAQLAEYVYDNGGRLTQQHEQDGFFRSGGACAELGGTGFPTSQFTNDTSGYSKGSLTGSAVTVSGSSTKIYKGYYYDVKGRVTKVVQNNLLGGYDVTNTVYTFTGQPATVTHSHTASGKSTRTEVYTYSYDHADRVSKVEHTLGGTKITLADYTYDSFGRLSTKSLHGSAANKLTYAYNLRSWLTGITSTRFTQNLYYNTGVGTARYNGSISSMTWKSGNESTVRGYKFTYDGLDRMLNATYGETAGISTNANRFSENVTGYDKNGNIKGLQRYGQLSSAAYGMIDNLTLTLNGNQLNRVDDAVAASTYNGGFEFKNGANAADEYSYDANGNLTKDLNKGISGITYNFLNLPNAVTFSDGSTITYTYGADGTKLRTVHKIGSTTTTTDYCGNVIYENGVQKLLLTEEGYVTLSDSKYHYYLKDHQGNNRVVINQSGTVEETNHYYPFGGVFASSGNVQPYKYNGKEYDGKKGLNWYDYGARHYDAALGRFTTNDRFSEKYHSLSPYQYGANNPVNTIDINGDSLLIVTPAAIEAIYNGLQDGSNIKMQFNNGILDPTSIAKQANSSNDFFLKDLFEIANSEKMVELSLSDKNTYKMNGKTVEETFGTPYDDDDSEIPAHQKEEYSKAGVPFGKHIQGNLGQTLVPDKRLASGKSSTNSHVQVIINKNGTLNHRTVGIAHEFGHVILYLRNVPFSHGQPGVNNFIYNKRADVMSKRLGYDY